MLKRVDGIEPPELTQFFERRKQEVLRQAGREGMNIGKAAEKRALSAIEALSLDHAWLQDVRLGTREKDARGIDIVAETPIGPLFVQIKSSVKGARLFRKRRRKSKIAVVVVEPEMPDFKIKEKLLGALSVLRNQILDLRRQSARKRKVRS